MACERKEGIKAGTEVRQERKWGGRSEGRIDMNAGRKVTNAGGKEMNAGRKGTKGRKTKRRSAGGIQKLK